MHFRAKVTKESIAMMSMIDVIAGVPVNLRRTSIHERFRVLEGSEKFAK